MPKLPNVPTHWVLEELESLRLRQNDPAKWDDPNKSCITCQFHKKAGGEKTFRWWNEDRTAAEEWECNCIAQWLLYRYMLSRGVGKSYQRLGWRDAIGVSSGTREEVADYLERADYYVERGLNLVLHSRDAGTGKTLMLMLLAKALMESGHDVFVAQMNSIVEMYTSGWRDKTEKDHFERRIMNCGFLVIDDLGKESGRNGVDFVDRLVDRVFRHRIANCLPTGISSNLDRDALESGYGKYVASLLTESCIFIAANGPDWRPLARERTNSEIREGLTRPLMVR